MGLSGDWTYEKTWNEPQPIRINYEILIDKSDPSKGTEQKVATFTDTQWSETYTRYTKFKSKNADGTRETQDLVTWRLRKTYTTTVAVAPNIVKAQLEEGITATNAEISREEETLYTYVQTEEGWTQAYERTETKISGYEFAGSMPISDFRAFVSGSLVGNLEQTIIASEVEKRYFSTNIAKNFASSRVKRKRIYNRTTTLTRSALAMTQEGQHYLQAVLKQETGTDGEGGEGFTITQAAWDEGTKMQADGTQVNSNLGRLSIEEKPSEYDEAEEELDEDDALEETGGTVEAVDSSTGYDDNYNSEQGNTSGQDWSTLDLVSPDPLRELWEDWTPYDDAGTGVDWPEYEWDSGSFPDGPNVTFPDPTSGKYKKAKYKFKKNKFKLDDIGEFSFDTDKPWKAKKFKISKKSLNGLLTNKIKKGERLMLNTPSGKKKWWYRIKDFEYEEYEGYTGEEFGWEGDGWVEVEYIPDYLDPIDENDRLYEDWEYDALITGVGDASNDVTFDMPYTPDDFMVCKDGEFVIKPANQEEAAQQYANVQKRLLEGQNKGINITTSLKNLPSAPFADVYLNMLGTAIYGRLNGTAWAFNDSGCVVSADVIYGGHAGRDGTKRGLEERRKILERNAQCPVSQTEGWINPPDGLKNDDLPIVTAEENPVEQVRKANSVEVDEDFDLDDLPCNFWTETLPLVEETEVPAETLETNHVYLPMAITPLEGRTRTRVVLTGRDYEPEPDAELITLVTSTHAANEYIDTAYYPKPLTTRTQTYAIVSGWNPDEGGGGGPEPPDPEQPVIDCTLRVKVGFGPTN